MRAIFITLLLTLFVAAILAFSIRGVAGNPTYQTLNKPEFKDEGPMELSPERGGFSLTYLIVEDKSFQFALPIAMTTKSGIEYEK